MGGFRLKLKKIPDQDWMVLFLGGVMSNVGPGVNRISPQKTWFCKGKCRKNGLVRVSPHKMTWHFYRRTVWQADRLSMRSFTETDVDFKRILHFRFHLVQISIVAQPPLRLRVLVVW